MNSQEHPLTDKILSEYPQINNEPASRSVFYRMTLERYEAFFAKKRYTGFSVSDEEILRDIFESIHKSPGLCYISLLIRENSDLICTTIENLKKIEQNTQKNGECLVEINAKVSKMEKALGNFSYQDFTANLSRFNVESGALREVVSAYNDRLTDHIKNIDGLASKESVENLNNNFERFRSDIGNATASTGFIGTVLREFSELRNKLTRTETGLGEQITQLGTGLDQVRNRMPGKFERSAYMIGIAGVLITAIASIFATMIVAMPILSEISEILKSNQIPSAPNTEEVKPEAVPPEVTKPQQNPGVDK